MTLIGDIISPDTSVTRIITMTLIGDIIYPDTFVSHYDRVLPETREDFDSLIANANAASRVQRAKDRRHQ